MVTTVALLAFASPAFATGRVPTGVKRISVTVTFPPSVNGGRKPVHRTLSSATSVRKVVNGADALKLARGVHVCPMYIRVSPVLTVIFRGPSGRKLAETQVQVILGSHGSSGSSTCFPIQFTAGTRNQRLVGNRYVRLMGRLIGLAIS